MTAQPAAGAEQPADRPQVITHNSASVDGRIALSPGVLLMTDPRWPASENPYREVLRRHRPQVLLEGSGSFVTDEQPIEPLPAPEPADPDLRPDHLPDHVRALATAGWLVVPDSRGRVRWQYKQFPGPEWQGWHLLVLVSAVTPDGYLAFLRAAGIPYLSCGRERVDLPAALARLRQRLGVRTVVSTGGGRLNGALLRAGVVDEIEIEVVPIAVGGTATASLFTAPDLPADLPPTALRLLAAETGPGDRVLLRYQVVREPSGQGR